jgi:coenzyme F420 hydrogenase subunit beta
LIRKSIITEIEKNNLCLGCGLCESVCGKDFVEMELQQNGFFRPNVKTISETGEKIIAKICPGVNVVNDIPFEKKESIWGKIDGLYSAYSNDSEVRTKGSSGGIVSAVAISLLENKKVDAVLQVGGDHTDYERNALRISRSRADVLNCASSRYAPALIFDKIFEILDANTDSYAFIGKPCDISALKNFLNVYPEYKNRFKLTVSIMCAGMPSFAGTRAVIDGFKAEYPVNNLVYRGNGWPGFFSFIDRMGREYRKSYNDSWGKVLNRHLNFRCKICPDGIGLQADLAVGDAWETKDGYPDFTEKEGHSLVISRTRQGSQVLEEMLAAGEMSSAILDPGKIALMQPYQFDRRRKVAARLIAFALVKGKMLNYQGVYIWHNLTKVGPLALLKEFYGTFKRLI